MKHGTNATLHNQLWRGLFRRTNDCCHTPHSGVLGLITRYGKSERIKAPESSSRKHQKSSSHRNTSRGLSGLGIGNFTYGKNPITVLWRFTWWRYLVMKVVRHGPQALADWFWYHSGIAEGLERLAREQGDWDQVKAVRDSLRLLEVRYGR